MPTVVKLSDTVMAVREQLCSLHLQLFTVTHSTLDS